MCVRVQAGVLAEGILKRLTSRAARIIRVNRTIHIYIYIDIYTYKTYWNTRQYLTYRKVTTLQSETKQCCEVVIIIIILAFVTVLFDVNPTAQFEAQAPILIMLPCVSEEEE